jgi:elongation factor Tu
MGVGDVFYIKGRGTVITGRLEGDVQLQVGDIAVCDGMRWKVIGIEMFGAQLRAAEPGANIGILINEGPSRDVLRDRVIQFESGSGTPMGPQYTVMEPRKKRWRR